jgi:predicted AAA+ superfamily ATPase
VIAAGSLLEFTLSKHSFSMPVGRVDYRYLGPMIFREYIVNLYPELLKYISSVDELNNMPDAVHIQLVEKFREYLFIGGMPAAVLAFKDTKDLNAVKSVHRSVCDTYLADFYKYAQSRDLMLLQKMFRSIPLNIGLKVKYSHYSKEHSSKEIKNGIELLIKARICNPIYSSDCSGLPLEASISRKVYKLVFLDAGLVNHICGLDLNNINALDDDVLVNKGQIAEQFIGQHLIYSDDMTKSSDLCYWLRENRNGNAEVDFVIVTDGRTTPIEVKSGKSGTLKSLSQFSYSKNAGTAIRFDLNRYSVQSVSNKINVGGKVHTAEYKLISYPLYAVSLLSA